MKVIRINETAHISARALQESAHAFTDTRYRQNPFSIPVSQLLRAERCRGFEDEQSISDHSKPHRFHSSIDRQSLRSNVYRGKRRSQLARVGPLTPLNLHHARSFSSQVQNPRPLLPRKPPPRRPLPSALSSREDDVPSSIPVITSAEITRRRNTQREQDRKEQIKEDIKETPWFKKATALFVLLEACEGNIASLQLICTKQKIEQHVKEVIDNFYRTHYQYKVNTCQERVNASEKFVAEFRIELDSGLAQAQARGKRDFEVREYWNALGHRDVFQEAEDVAVETDAIRKNLADVLYTIHRTAWVWKRTRFVLEQSTRASRDLKSESGSQASVRRKMDDIDDIYTKLARLLDEMDKSLITHKQTMSRTQVEHYTKIYTIALDIESFSNNISPSGHDWRTLDLRALLESRFPQFTDHMPAEIRARQIIGQARQDMKVLGAALSRAVREPTTTAIYESRLPVYAKMRATFQTYNDLFASVSEQYLEFLREGLFMLNPAISSDVGRLKYAFVRPFSLFTTGILEIQRTLRDGMESIKALRGWTEKDARADQSDSVRKWSSDLYRTFDDSHQKSKETVRQLLEGCNHVILAVFARISVTGDNYLSKKLSLQADDERVQLSHGRILESLSSLKEYRDTTYTEPLADPVRLMGRRDLYPAGKPYPVQLLSSNRDIFKALQDLLREKVVGVDVFHRADISQKGAFISIATTEKVVVIDWNAWTTSEISALGLNQNLLRQLLETDDILKVVHNIDAIRPYFTNKTIFPRNLVSLTRPESPSSSNGTTSLLRAVSAKNWKPPRHTFDKQLLMPFLTDLAFLSVHSLWTFLLKVPLASIKSLNGSSTRTYVLRAREQLSHIITTAGQNTTIELGPLNVGAEGPLVRLIARFNADVHRTTNVVRVARIAARVHLPKHVGKSTNFQNFDDMVAYYMFTSMGQELSSIGVMLGKQTPANDILRAVEKNNLILHANDRLKLELAEKSAGQDTESMNVPLGFGTIESPPANILTEADQAGGIGIQLFSAQQLQTLRLWKTAKTAKTAKLTRRERKKIVRNRQDDLSKKSPSSHFHVAAKAVPMYKQPQEASVVGHETSQRSEQRPGYREFEAGALRKGTTKLSHTMLGTKAKLPSRGLKKRGKSVASASRTSTIKKPPAAPEKIREKSQAGSVTHPPTVHLDWVKPLLAPPTHKTSARSAQQELRSDELMPRTAEPCQDNTLKELKKNSVAVLRVKKSEVKHKRQVFNGARFVQSGGEAEHASVDSFQPYSRTGSVVRDATGTDEEVKSDPAASTPMPGFVKKVENIFKGVRSVLSEASNTTSKVPKSSNQRIIDPKVPSDQGKRPDDAVKVRRRRRVAKQAPVESSKA